MSIYKVVCSEFHQVIRICTQSFDTSNQNAWDLYRKEYISIFKADKNTFPEKAPNDPMIWFKLLSHLSVDEYELQEEDWYTVKKGGYKRIFDLIDENEKVITTLEK